MNKAVLFSVLIVTLLSCKQELPIPQYEANMDSLKKVNPAPEWFRDAKYGIYFHWGVYSVPAFGNEWYPRHMYKDSTREKEHHIETYGPPEQWPYHNFINGAENKSGEYVQFAPKLKSEGGAFDPEEWAELFAQSGAKFAGPVAEHHDGFSMWDSEANPWNAMDKGPGVDLVGELAKAIRKRDMKLILSMHHAFNITGFYEFVPETEDPELKILYGQQGKEANESLWLTKHKEIIDQYQPDIIWQDFNLTALSQDTLLAFLAYYYNAAEEWGKEVVTTYKDALNHDVAVLDYERGGPYDLKDYYWLTDDAISQSSWCYTEGISYFSSKAVLHSLFDRVSKNGNLLLNISPKADGSIPEAQKQILLDLGEWLGKYGEAIYNSRAWVKFGEGPTEMGSGHAHEEGASFRNPVEGKAEDIRFTRSKDNKDLYVIFMDWPGNNNLNVTSLNSKDFNPGGSIEKVTLLNNPGAEVVYTQDDSGMQFELPSNEVSEKGYVLKLEFVDSIPELTISD